MTSTSSPATASGTDWVVTFPTKFAYTGPVGTGAAIAPFNANFNNGQSCDIFTMNFWNREELTTTTPVIVLPSPEPSVVVTSNTFCYEANVLTFANSNILGSTNLYNIDTTSIGRSGWASIGFTQAIHIGPAHTKHLLLTARPISARRAFEVGMVHELLAPAEFEDGVANLAATVAANAPLSLTGMKLAVHRAIAAREGIAHDDIDATHGDIDATMSGWSAALALNPWLRRFPMAIRDVWVEPPLAAGGRWRLRDRAGHILPLPPQFGHGWSLLALSAGRPMTLFGEWDGALFVPASVLAGTWQPLSAWKVVV